MEQKQASGIHQDQPGSAGEFFETVIIGGGQSGLSVGYGLQRKGRPFIILDENRRIGDAWRNRWDSLRLFTPAYLDGLDGMRFPGNPYAFVSKDEMADYLETYAKRFQLPVRTGVHVGRLSRQGKHFIISAGEKTWRSDSVVVAVSSFHSPKIPDFSRDLHPSILQLNSKEYRNPSQLKKGKALVVGAGNSGAEIALDVVKEHQTYLSGRDTGHVPFRIEPAIARILLIRLVKILGHHVLNTGGKAGRKARARLLHSGGQLVRTKPQDLIAAGVERVVRVAGVDNGWPVLEGGRVLKVENVIWCTGFSPGFSWIDLPVLDEYEEPVHERGIVESEPGLYFVGLHFLYAASSATISGMKRDARYIVRQIVNS